jgi:hypothetical protein
MSEMKDEILEKAKCWHNRNDEENTVINVSWLESNVLEFEKVDLKANKWIFSHVPKTAGTALESYLTQAFALKDILNINGSELINFPECLYMKNRWPKFITGRHSMQGLLYQLLDENKVVHISMMRDPVERVVSFYNHKITKEYQELKSQEKVISFDDFINQSEVDEINNGQAKRFAGTLSYNTKISDKELYFRAKYSIDKCYSIVGVTEFFTQLHKLIAKKCGVKFHDLPPITRLETKVQFANLNPQQLTLIKRKNKVDIQLYQYVRSKFLNLMNL